MTSAKINASVQNALINDIFAKIIGLSEITTGDFDEEDSTEITKAACILKMQEESSAEEKLLNILALIDATTTQVKYSIGDKDATLQCLRKAVKCERRARMNLHNKHRRLTQKCENAILSVQNLQGEMQEITTELRTETRRRTSTQLKVATLQRELSCSGFEVQSLKYDIDRMLLRSRSSSEDRIIFEPNQLFSKQSKSKKKRSKSEAMLTKPNNVASAVNKQGLKRLSNCHKASKSVDLNTLTSNLAMTRILMSIESSDSISSDGILIKEYGEDSGEDSISEFISESDSDRSLYSSFDEDL